MGVVSANIVLLCDCNPSRMGDVCGASRYVVDFHPVFLFVIKCSIRDYIDRGSGPTVLTLEARRAVVAAFVYHG